MKDMIRSRWFLASLAVLILTGMIILSTALAQPRGGAGWDNGDDQQPPPPNDRGGPGPDGRGGRRPGSDGGPMGQLHNLRELMGLIDDIHKVASSPSASAVLAVMSTNEQFHDPHASITFLEKMLPEAKDDTVARAIRIQLADLYKRTDQHDKAAEQLEKLITGK